MDTANVFSCPLCGAKEHRQFHQLVSFGVKVNYYQCKTCGFVFQNSAESQAGDPAFYAQTYRKIYQKTELPTAKDLRQQRLRAEEGMRFLKENGVTKLSRTLDIGASSGLFLEYLQSAFGAEPIGVEMGQAYRDEAASKGITMFANLEALKASTFSAFELVSLMHVLEHLNDPIGNLIEIRQHFLSADGYLLVEVPNLYAHDSFELAHLSCFTPHTLKQSLAKSGYELIRLKAHGYPRSKTLKLFLTALARPKPQNDAPFHFVYEKNVATKRQMGFLWRKLITKVCPKQTWLPLEDK
ncbi:MAG: class I SAM-dependent methyltransferase [Anaerolineaceae bacterium]|nr:class I SAM-dependent methyltransferase [Anaerolineaceae bacterium]